MNENLPDRPEWAETLEEQIGEDPTRFLIGRFGPIDVPPLVLARIKGIDSIAVARAWIAAERRLGFNRDGVIGRLKGRIEQLEEIGERKDRLEVGERTPSPEKEVVFLDENGEQYTPEEWRGSSASAKLARIREDSEEAEA